MAGQAWRSLQGVVLGVGLVLVCGALACDGDRGLGKIARPGADADADDLDTGGEGDAPDDAEALDVVDVAVDDVPLTLDVPLDLNLGGDPEADTNAEDVADVEDEVAPTGCVACHGQGDDPAPPRDLTGQMEPTAMGVGAHAQHGGESSWHAPVACESCHVVPEADEAEGHMDETPSAEVVWDGMAAPEGWPAPSWSEGRCDGVYCHGATLPPSGSNTAPTWTDVGTGQAGCGTCHGVPPLWPHPERSDCESCHGTMGPGQTFVEPERHIDGVLDVLPLMCSSCHGDDTSASPPLDTRGNTDTTAVGVGAHRSHEGRSWWRRRMYCGECHTTPGGADVEGHRDSPLPAELNFGAVGTANGALSPVWDGQTCAQVYCHGATLRGAESRPLPNWTHVGQYEGACGSCHGVPPSAPHVQDYRCNLCHDSLDDGNVFDPERHIDGVLDVREMSCDTCHGSALNPAPPNDTAGRTATTERGVGAHQSHLGASDWRAAIACEACHTVPETFDAPGHLDSVLPAEVTFGEAARGGGAAPSWDGEACAGVYCHGANLDAGGSHTAPTWTAVGAGEAECGTCHGAPPTTGNHPANDRCGTCHPTMAADGTFVSPERHIDGVLDVIDLQCNSCHGGEANAGPPRDTQGGQSTDLRGVGAHQSHLGASDWRAPVGCEACHAVPEAFGDAGHLDSALPAEVTFGALARTEGAAPSWDGESCGDVYCHGANLGAGGSHTAPTWTAVGTGEAECGTCHGAPPTTGNHPASTGCGACHPTMAREGGFLAPERHIDGVLDVIDLQCNSCHGGEANAGPPRDTQGGQSTDLRGVGAHQSHLGTSSWRADIGCDDCHVTPGAIGDVGHTDSALPAELRFGPVATALGANPQWDGVRCTNVYCHGEVLDANGTQHSPTWTRVGQGEADCGTCHGAPPTTGWHPDRTDCATCHPTVDTAGTIITPERHIDGQLDVYELDCIVCHPEYY